jgi:hypothetical protein
LLASWGHPVPVKLIFVPGRPDVGVKVKATSGVVWAADGPAAPTSWSTIAAAANAANTLRFLNLISLSSLGPVEGDR